MRIALLGICHETNTFSSVTTDLAKFERDGILRGDILEVKEFYVKARDPIEKGALK